MAKQPFTPGGVQLKMAELYALADDDLRGQANLVRANLRDWVKDNFSLSADQVTFLNGMDNRWVQVTACEAGFAIENRLVIELVEHSGSPTASKLLRKKNQTIAATGQNGGFTATGSIVFEIIYV